MSLKETCISNSTAGGLDDWPGMRKACTVAFSRTTGRLGSALFLVLFSPINQLSQFLLVRQEKSRV
jgi:hypothetical protein